MNPFLKNLRLASISGYGVILAFLSMSCEKRDELDLSVIRSSIFKIQVESAAPRYDQPWLNASPRSSSGTGFYIGDGQILTNAHVVSHGKYITVQRDGRPDVVSAKVQYIAHDADLAILQVQDETYLKDVRPLKLGGIPVLRKPVSTVGYPMGGEQISVTDGVVSRISFRRYAHTGHDSHLLVQVDSAINPGNSGGPVFQGGQVVGVAFQAFTRAENTGYIIPIPVVQRFLKDVEDGSYDGHPKDGLLVMTQSLENPAARRYFGLTADEGGVQVSHVSAFSTLQEVVQAGDILLKIEGHEIGVDGKISLYGERIDFRTPIDLAQAGDQIEFLIIRNGSRQTVKGVISVIEMIDQINHRYQLYPRFVIYGGMVFTSLSRNYLQTWGQHWYFKAPVQLRYVHQYFSLDPQFQGRDEAIVLVDRLPDPVNQSARRFVQQVLDQVNGQSIRNLGHLAEILEKPAESDLVMKFLYEQAPLILNHQNLAEQHEPILRRYRVGLQRWLDENTDGATANWEGH